MPLTSTMSIWISKRKERFEILLALRDGRIGCIEAEKQLRALDGEERKVVDYA